MLLRVITLIIFGNLQIGVRSNTLPISDDGYKYTPGIGRHKVHSVAKMWDEARLICLAEGGDLAVINCRQESKVIAELLNASLPHIGSFDSNYALVGFNDRVTETDYRTVADEPLEQAGFNEWDPFEPNNAEGIEDCGSISHSGRFNDISCNNPHAFVCEKPEYEKGLPVKVNVTAEDKIIIEGNRINITCNVVGYPAPTVEWYKDGNSLLRSNRINMANEKNLIIAMANKNDAGKYRCDAANAFTTDSGTVDIVVIVPVKVEIVVEKGLFHEGSQVLLVCNVDGYPMPNVVWYKDDNSIPTSNRIKVSSVNSLLISHAAKNDAGIYRCFAANDHTNDTQTVDIKIDVPVEVKISVQKNTFADGSQISIVCNVDGYPTPKVDWYKDDNAIQTNQRINIIGNTLIISTADKNDAGMYRCDAANEYSSGSDSIDIKMAVQPKVRLSVDKNPFLKGSEFIMTCDVDDYPTSTLTWYKDGNPIQRSGRIEISGNKLTISNAETNDAGNYRCEASNQYTTNADSLDINAIVPVEVEIVVDGAGPIKEGSKFTMTCNADGFPVPTMQWYKDNNLIQTTDRIEISANKLTVTDADKNDAGTYRCQAANQYTSSTHTVDIVVIVPVTVHARADKQLFSLGNSVTIVCNVVGHPIPKVRWYKDDVSIQENQNVKFSAANSLIIINADKNDAGRYRCDAANGYSSNSDTVEIKMNGQDEAKISTGKTSFVKDGEMSLTCNVDDHMIPSLIWYKDNDPIQPNYRIKIIGKQLVINPAETSDSGKYRCATSNSASVGSDPVDVTVTVPVQVNVTIAKGLIHEGNKLTLTCNVEGYPTPTIQWYKDGNLIQTNYRIFIFSNELIISGLEKNDAGGYTCKAANEFTSGAHTVDLQYTVPVKVHAVADQKSVLKGGAFSIFCNVDGYPAPEIRWYKDNIPIQPNHRVQISASNTLNISDAIESDSAGYRCEATNGYTSGAHTVDVSVRERVNVNVGMHGNPGGRSSRATCQKLEDWIFLCTDYPQYIHH